MLNLSDLARDAHLPLTTLQRHWALLEAVFFVRTLPAWSGNLTTRLAKAPKILLNDTGLLCHILNLEPERLKADEWMSGSILGSFVAMELAKQAAWSSTRPALFHFRTQKQQEVDLVMEDAAGRLVGVEVKKTASPASSDFKALRHLGEQTDKKFLRGILLYTGFDQRGLWTEPARSAGQRPMADRKRRLIVSSTEIRILRALSDQPIWNQPLDGCAAIRPSNRIPPWPMPQKLYDLNSCPNYRKSKI